MTGARTGRAGATLLITLAGCSLLAGCVPSKKGVLQLDLSRVIRALARVIDRVGVPAPWAKPVLNLVEAALVIVLFWFGAILVSRALAMLFATFTLRSVREGEVAPVATLQRPIRAALRLLGVYLALVPLPVPDRVERYLAGVLYVLLVFLTVRIGTTLAGLVAREYIFRSDFGKRAEQLEREYVPLARAVSGIFLVTLGLLATVNHFGGKVSSIITAFGFIGAALGLAARDILSQLFAGLALLIDRPFRVGDRLQLATQEIGDVLRIGARSTELKLLNGNVLVVPNSELIAGRIHNFSQPTIATQLKIPVQVPYGTDLETARRLLLEAAAAHREVVAEPAPTAYATAFADAGITVELSVTMADYAKLPEVGHELRAEIARRFAAERMMLGVLPRVAQQTPPPDEVKP